MEGLWFCCSKMKHDVTSLTPTLAPLLSSPLLSSKSQVGCPRNGSGGRLFPFPTIARIAAAVANNVRHTSYRKLDIYSTYFGQREHSALIGTRFGTFESVNEGHDTHSLGGLSHKGSQSNDFRLWNSVDPSYRYSFSSPTIS